MTDRFRKSAVAIVMSRRGTERVVLTGRRNPASRFLGGFHAFPGGVLDATDGDLATDGEAACLARTAARELAEETGIRVAPEDFLPAGRRQSPPFTPVRFDSLIFVTFLPEPGEVRPGSDELSDLAWSTAAELVERWRRLEIRIAPPLLPMLEALATLPAGALDSGVAEALEAANTFPEDEGPRIEFVPGVFLVPQRTPTLPPATTTNCFLVGTREMLVIDPGSADPIEEKRLRKQIARRAPARPSAIVLTHHHVDHVGGAAALSRDLSLPVWAHSETLSRWADVGLVARGAGTRALADGEILRLSGGEEIQVLHTPGHAAGHVALFETGRGSLFVGDLVSGVSTVLLDAAPDSLDRYLDSVTRLRDLPARTLFPAHGPPAIEPRGALQAVLDHRAERESRILAAVRSGDRSIEAIVATAYADTPSADPGLAARQAGTHLARLEGRGLVRRTRSGWEPAE